MLYILLVQPTAVGAQRPGLGLLRPNGTHQKIEGGWSTGLGCSANFGINGLYYDRICSSHCCYQAIASTVGARRPGSGLLRRDPLFGAPQWHTSKN